MEKDLKPQCTIHGHHRSGHIQVGRKKLYYHASVVDSPSRLGVNLGRVTQLWISTSALITDDMPEGHQYWAFDQHWMTKEPDRQVLFKCLKAIDEADRAPACDDCEYLRVRRAAEGRGRWDQARAIFEGKED